jgi:hypothetical protein
MKLLLALAVGVALAGNTFARIGETMLELRQRYGQPIGVEGNLDEPTSRWTFHDHGYAIIVTVRKNRSVSEEFTRRDRRDFTRREVLDLLEDNAAPGADWQEINGRQWRQGDRVATWLDRSLLMREDGVGD